MEQLIFMVGISALFVVNALIAWVLAWFLTEVTHLPWYFKPFNCRGCLSFWLTFVLGTVLAFIVTPYLAEPGQRFIIRYGLCAVSFLLGVINYQYIKIKFRIYE